MRLRLLERVGSAIGFSPEGRCVRVWVRGHPGADETEVVPGTIEAVRPDGAVLRVTESDGPDREVLAVPHEPGWGFQALWFSFIAVDVFELDGEGGLARAEAGDLGGVAGPLGAGSEATDRTFPDAPSTGSGAPPAASSEPADDASSEPADDVSTDVPRGSSGGPSAVSTRPPTRADRPAAPEPFARWFIRLGSDG